MKEKTHLLAQIGVLSEVFYYFIENLPLSHNYITSDGAVSHNLLYYQQLSVTRYQVSFYANSYFLVITNSLVSSDSVVASVLQASQRCTKYCTFY